MIPSILDMLTYCRPAGSATERVFVDRFIRPLPGAYQDIYGNWIVQTDANATILFSAHTDTVHRQDGRQTVACTADGIVTLSRRSRHQRNCLGADDTAGCWILINLIRANVPGTYIFHYGEERGCIGSSALAGSCEPWLKRFKHAIAFDRRGTTDVITHQLSSRCASEAFATALAGALTSAGLPGYFPEHGVYTDTASYVDIIPECTNISVGYEDEHSARESLDTAHLGKLRDALLRIDWTALIVDRDPNLPDPDDETWGFWRSSRRYESSMTLCMTCGSEFDGDERCCPDCGEDDPSLLFDDDQPAVIRDHPYLDDTYAQVQRDLEATLDRWRRDRDGGNGGDE